MRLPSLPHLFHSRVGDTLFMLFAYAGPLALVVGSCTPTPAAAQTGTYQATPPALANGQRNDLRLDSTGALVVTGGTGGGGGGGAVTIADGADTAEGSRADTASTATDTTPASLIALNKGQLTRLATITTNQSTEIGQLTAINAKLPTAIGQQNAAGSLSVVLASGTALSVTEATRTAYIFESQTTPAGSGTVTATTRDAGVSPTSWATFSCSFLSTGAGYTAYVDGSDDGSTFQLAITASGTAGAPLILTTRLFQRYYRCRVLNGATSQQLTLRSAFSVQ